MTPKKRKDSKSSIYQWKGPQTRELPEPYHSRLPDIQRWRVAFGDDFKIADQVLCIFCAAFMFSSDERYKFEPDDTVMAIYRAVYPSRWTPDSLEQPILIDTLEKEFNFTFDPTVLEKTETLRQIVAEIKEAQQRQTKNPALPVRDAMFTYEEAKDFAVNNLLRDAEFHEAGNYQRIGDNFDRYDAGLLRDGDPRFKKLHIALNFWDSWQDSRNHDWLFYKGIEKDDWSRLAREIANNIAKDEEITDDLILKHFDQRQPQDGILSRVRSFLKKRH